ncbi:MAG: hypothetical protein A2X59_06225 [Nitrospirae bacterium GWC2_42_7]|nr:MAG: hypothetical protein A2X59_06225 [Nitrospirae bacterium GWC2_42_7]
MKTRHLEKRYSETTDKLHIPCPHSATTGINVHVVIKNGHCYRSENCLVIRCKFNRLQSDIESLISLTW